MASSDADAPKQTFKIGANGADVGAEDESSGTRRSAAEDSGCGCKAAGTPVGSSGWAGLALAALGAVVLVRRRRDAA